MKKIYKILFFILFSSITIFAGESRCKDGSYFNLGSDKNQNETALQKIVQTNPKDMECTLKLIHIYLKKGEVAKGLELLVKAYKIDPEFIKSKKIHKILKIAQYLTNLKKKALSNNDTNSWNILGAAYYKMGVFNESIKAYNKSLQINSKQIDARLTLALDLYRTNQAYRAIEELRKVISMDKDNFYAYYYAGKILKYQIKDNKKAKVYLVKAKILCEKQKKSFSKNIYKEYMEDLNSETKK